MSSPLRKVLLLIAVLKCGSEHNDTQSTDQCVIDRIIENGSISSLAIKSEKYNVNQTVRNFEAVEYSCNVGYTMVGSNKNICIDGSWIKRLPNCELLCQPTTLTSPTYFANCYKEKGNKRITINCNVPVYSGTVAQISCQRNYENKKAEQQIVTCGNDGHWHPLPEPCTQVCGEEGPEGTAYIVGGMATNLTKVPWNVGVYRKLDSKQSFQQICGGTIVNARVVISAMHCFWDRVEGKPYELSEFRIAAGKFFRALDSRENQQTATRHIIRLLYEEDYLDYRGLYEKDIAIIILNRHFDFDPHISPICLDYDTAANEAVPPESYGRVAGWGLESSNGLPSPILKYIELPVIAREKCIADSPSSFVPFITKDKFCAGYLTGYSVCQGDSGAGLVFERNVNGKKRYYLRGIVSTGSNKHGSCDNDQYTTFTNIAYFIEFIKLYEIPYRPEFIGTANITNYTDFSGVHETSCAILQIPINGSIALPSAPDVFLKYGEVVGNHQVVQYTCKTNLTLVGESKNICFKREWVHEVPTCSTIKTPTIRNPRSCQIVTDLENGSIDLVYSPFQQLFPEDMVNSGSSVIYHCDENFELNGTESNICKNSKWKYRQPQCISNCSLDVLGGVLNRGYSCILNGVIVPCANEVQPGTTLKINCSSVSNRGTSDKFHETACESNGNWSPNPKSCVSTCFSETKSPHEPLIYRLGTSGAENCTGTALTPTIILAVAECFRNSSIENEELDDPSNFGVIYSDANKLQTYEINSIRFDKSLPRYGAPVFALAVLKNPIQINNQTISICWYPGIEYEQVLRYGKTGLIPDLHVARLYDSTTSYAIGYQVDYDLYKEWLASKVLRARSESFTDSSDNSYASETSQNESSEASTNDSVSSGGDSKTTSKESATVVKKITTNHIKKDSTTSGGSTGTNSESSDPVESDFESETEYEEVVEEGAEEEEDEEEVEETDDSEEDSEEETDSDEETSEEIEDVSVTYNFKAPAKKKTGFDLDDFDIIKTIGTGTFGRVCLCQDKTTNTYCAMKILAMADVIRLKQVEHVKNEKSILAEINHPFIVNLLWYTKDDYCLYMLFEYVVGGELFTYLRNAGRFPTSTANFYASEIILALEYLHSLSIVYRDLKPENLLIDRDGHLKITDFGFAKKLKDRTWTLCGTPEYLAPEIIQSKGHNKAVDWWALGILIYEMLVGYPPFYDDNPFGIYEKILSGKIDWPKQMDPVAKDLLKKLLVPDRTKRLGNMKNGGEDVRRHRWFKHLDWDDVYKRKITPPIIPKVNCDGDTSNFDDYPETDWKAARSLHPKELQMFVDF